MFSKMKGNGFCFVAMVVAGVLLCACASRGMIEGGPKDVTPPEITEEVPASGTTRFTGKRVDIHFNEFVQLKDINSKFVISPPQKKKPKTTLRGKYVRVEFQDSLKPGTTYTLDFQDAIVDNNEGNPLGYYRYVFSTGEQLDTMELGGQVLDAESCLPVLGAMVLFYENTADSAALVELPSYVAMTDSSGNFRVTNMRDGHYRVLAIEDLNRDNMFLPEEERVGFVDTLVRTVCFPAIAYDTIRPDTVTVAVRKNKERGQMEAEVLTRDTVVVRHYTAYGPINLFMRLFAEEKTQLYSVDQGRPERERLDFTFSIPAENNLQVRFLGLNLPEGAKWFIEERSMGRDTISLWIRDSLIYKIDSLQAAVSYLYTDSLGQRVTRTDTTRFVYRDKPTPKGKRKDKDTVPELKFMAITASVNTTMDLNKPIVLDFDRPIDESRLDSIHLFEMVDSVWTPTAFKVRHDSLKIRRYYLEKEWKPETEYRLFIDSASMYSIYGLFNNRVEQVFKTKAVEDYGRIILKLSGVTCPLILQLYQGGTKELKVLEERRATGNGDVIFDYLNEGTYMVRVVLDENGNGKWDTGNYLKHVQPEMIKYFPAEFKIKKNFDIEQSYDVSRTYVREDPSKKKDTGEDDRRGRRNR